MKLPRELWERLFSLEINEDDTAHERLDKLINILLELDIEE